MGTRVLVSGRNRQWALLTPWGDLEEEWYLQRLKDLPANCLFITKGETVTLR